jgi:hypothetical protein
VPKTVEFTIPELLERLHAGQIPTDAKVQVTFEDAEAGAASHPASNAAKHDPSIALFAQWDEEDTRMTPEQRAENERVYAEIEANGIARVRI